MKKTIITLSSVIALSSAANAQVTFVPTSLDSSFTGTGTTINGTFDISALTGIAGLQVTVTNGLIGNSGTIFNARPAETVFVFNQAVDVLVEHGPSLPLNINEGITSDAPISFTGVLAPGVTVNEVPGLNGAPNLSEVVAAATATGGGDGNIFTFTSAGATTITAFSSRTIGTNGFSFQVTPNSVPEPSTALLGALAGLGFLARRKRA